MRTENGEQVFIGVPLWKKLKELQLSEKRAKLHYNDYCKENGLLPNALGKHGSPQKILSLNQRRDLTKSIKKLKKGMQ